MWFVVWVCGYEIILVFRGVFILGLGWISGVWL